MNATLIQIANGTTLGIAIAWVIWQLFSLRRAATQGGDIFPAIIPTLFIFMGAIAVVELLHFSPLHLIWLFAVSLLMGVAAIISPTVQNLSMSFLGLLTATSTVKESAEEKTSQTSQTQPKTKKSSKGFG